MGTVGKSGLSPWSATSRFVGSNPIGTSIYVGLSSVVERCVVAANVMGSNPIGQPSGGVTELAYVSDSKSEFCGFKSHLPYLPMPALKHWCEMMLSVKQVSQPG